MIRNCVQFAPCGVKTARRERDDNTGRNQPLLDVAGLRVTYGGVVAVSDVDLQIREGTVYGLIGPNGAGKTSMVDALTGYTKAAAGRVAFDGARHQPAASLPARPAAAWRGPSNRWSCSTTSPSTRTCSWPASTSASARRCGTCSCPTGRPTGPASTGRIGVCGLQDVVDRYPSEISLGKRKLVGVGRALARQPRLVLLDEPAAGLDTDESLELGRRLRALQRNTG